MPESTATDADEWSPRAAGGILCDMLAGSLVALLALPLVPNGSPSPEPGTDGAPAWNARHAEHLLNRAGFGASPGEVSAAVAAGLDATIARLLAGSGQPKSLLAPDTELGGGIERPLVMDDGPALDEGETLVIEDPFYFDRGAFRRLRVIREYTGRWVQGMVDGVDPLRDRMTIFWHGHLVSSFDEVGDAQSMVAQIDYLRLHALDDFETLMRGIARDPAMLEYLNNDLNVKTSPNENWARELMELFTLGEGNYTEDDIKEAARAFSGWTKRNGTFVFAREEHDWGPKTVLGVTGNLDGDAVIAILLEEESCARFLAEKLIAYLEGEAPTIERVDRYAQLLRDAGYETTELLGALFRDPEFYREAIVGRRIAAPVEYYVGMARRLGIEPPPDMLYVLASMSGQQLFAPPNVKGWEEGFAWLTTSSVMQRSNLGAVMLGEYDRRLDPYGVLERTVGKGRRAIFAGAYRDYVAMVAWLERSRWRPDLPLADDLREAGRATDAEVVESLLERLLAVPVPGEVAEELERVVGQLKAEGGQADGSLLDAGAAKLLERVIHIILSLPEAQVL
jgi:hypothetical protein